MSLVASAALQFGAAHVGVAVVRAIEVDTGVVLALLRRGSTAVHASVAFGSCHILV